MITGTESDVAGRRRRRRRDIRRHLHCPRLMNKNVSTLYYYYYYYYYYIA